MKKKMILTTFVVIMLCFIYGRKVDALGNYCNLIDINQIEYDEFNDIFFCNQQILLQANTSYTLVASSCFFGDVTRGRASILDDRLFGTVTHDLNANVIELQFRLKFATAGLYYSTVIPTVDCKVQFDNFLTKGFDYDSLPREEIILYEGTKEEFKGFRKADHLDGYESVSNSIDIYTSCLNPIKSQDLIKRIKWYDNEMGIQDEPIVVSNNYTDDAEIGDYSIVFEATDKSNNKATLMVNVKVIDNEGPVIIGPDYIEWDCYTADVVPDNVLKHYIAYDTVDGDVTKNLKTETFIMGIFERGVKKDYEFVMHVSDKAGNKTTRTIIIKSRDILPPELSVRDLTINLSELGKKAFSDLFGQTIVEVSDYSGICNLEYKCVEEIGKMGFSGTFKVYVSARDGEGNTTEKISTIRVIDDIEPEFYLYIDLLNTTPENVYSLEMLKEIISENLYNDGILFDNVNIISCDYLANENVPGVYKVKYNYTYKGETTYVIGNITVSEIQKDKNPIIFYIIAGVIVLMSISFVIKRSKELY